MLIEVHPAETMLRGDAEGYNPRGIVAAVINRDGDELVEGVFEDDGRTDGSPRRPIISFQIILPANFRAWHALNAHTHFALTAKWDRVIINARAICN